MTTNQQLTEIAKKYLGIETLETRNSDRLDFHDVGVGCLLDALTASFEAGRREAQQQAAQKGPTLFEAARDGDAVKVRDLLQAGAGANELIEDGTTALMVAAYRGNKEIVELLVGRGAPIDAQDKDGCTALMRAAWQGHTEVVGLLINQGAAVNIQDQSGEDALMNAAQRERIDIVKMLLAAGADITQKDWRGATAEDLARLQHRTSSQALLAVYRQTQEQDHEQER
jgi:ankyrin repeat protein